MKISRPNFRHILCLMFLFGISLQALETAQLRLSVQKNRTLVLTNRQQIPGGWKKAKLQPVMTFSARTPAPDLPQPEILNSRGDLKIRYQTDAWEWQISFSRKDKIILAESRFTNKSQKELWLEPGFRLILSEDARTVWHGFKKAEEISDQEITRKGIKGAVEQHVNASAMPFPASAVSIGKSVLFTGTVPFDDISYTAGSHHPATRSLSYTLRLVSAPGTAITFRQTVGSVVDSYGMQEGVVQQYYEAFPECWAVIRGEENPYIWGCHGQYLNWWSRPERELSRRLGITLEWAYCPYKRSGDMRCRPELWDYQPNSPYRPKKYELGTVHRLADQKLEDYLSWRRSSFRSLGRKFGLMFYNTVSGIWCEYNLAREKYPDAINHDKTVMYILSRWSTHHDREIRVFPLGTSFAEVFKEDMAYLAEDLDLPGFAMDCAYGGAYYRGPAVDKNLPGRAWDDRGKFIDQSVAVNHEVDFIHQINTRPDRRLTCFINGYLKGDYIMVEAPFLNLGKWRRWMPLLRWYIGPRPGCVHGHGFLFREIVPDWRDKTQEEFKEIIGKMSDFVIMNEFKYGLTGSHLTQRGNPQQLYNLPELQDLMKAGWQAEIPMILSKGMRVPYRARYGRDLTTCFFLGNSGPKTVSGKISFDNNALRAEKWSLLFVRKMRRDSRTLNCLTQAFTSVHADLPSRTPVLYEAVAAIDRNQESGKWLVETRKTLHRQFIRLKKLDGSRRMTKVRFRRIRGFRLHAIRLDNQTILLPDHQILNQYLAKDSVLEAEYHSELFHLSADELLAFPFTSADKKPSFSVEITSSSPETASSRRMLLELGGRFNEYFSFCRSKKIISGDAPDVKISLAGQCQPRPGVASLLLTADFSAADIKHRPPKGISLINGGLVLAAENQKEADRMLTELFNVMDRRYPCTFGFQTVMGLQNDILNHYKVYGYALPCRKYFEEVQQ